MRFRLLGPLEVRAGEDWSGIGAGKQRSLLAALLLHPGQAVSTERLIGEIWGEEPPARATNLVSIYVLKLRKLIGDPDGKVLVTRSPGYQLRLAPGDLDTARFAELVTEGRRALAAGAAERASALLSEALGLWRGQPLADIPVTDLVAAEVHRLEESRLTAFIQRIEAELVCGRAADVVAGLHRLIADYPMHEELWALLMRALHAAGRQAEALKTYEQARMVISDQLGVDPGAELQALHRQILAADARPAARPAAARPAAGGPPAAHRAAPARPSNGATQRASGTAQPSGGAARAADGAAQPSGAAARAANGARGTSSGLAEVVPAQLPADIADFTGRSNHVKHLCDLLSAAQQDAEQPGAVVISLVAGAGGLGKTTLAVHTAHRLRARFLDGQLYVSLQGASGRPVAPVDVLARFLRELGVDGPQIPVGEEERAALYRTRIAGRRMLIVLDDARDAAQVRPLLPGTASCGVLVTSRNRLPDLAGSRLVDLDVLDDDEARALLTRIVGPERLEAEPEATGQVLAACAGLPLAIRIAGARLSVRTGWTIRTLARRLSDERRRIDELMVGDLAVRACFQVSFASLPSAGAGGVDPARAFRLLGLWQGPFIGLAAAAALLGEPDDDVADALEVLVDANLLQSPAAEIYRFHDLLRVYAAERAWAQETQQDRHAAVRRLLTWYLHTSDAAVQLASPHRRRVPLEPVVPGSVPLTFATADQALDWCEKERANLVAATRQAAENGLHEIAWKLPVALLSFFNQRGHWVDWAATHRIGLDSARRLGDRQAEAWTLNNLGMVLGKHRIGEAVGYLQQALAIYRELGDRRGEAQAGNNLADAYLLLGRFAEATEPLQLALVIHRENGSRYGEGIALHNLGEAYLELGRVDDAIGCLEQAREIFREIHDTRGEGYTWHNLGRAHLELGRIDEATACLQRALTLRRAHRDRHSEALTLIQLGHADRRAGRPAQARDRWAQALAIFRDLGDDAKAAEADADMAALGTS